MTKKGFVRFIRFMAYAHIFTVSFSDQNPIAAITLTLVSIVVLHMT